MFTFFKGKFSEEFKYATNFLQDSCIYKSVTMWTRMTLFWILIQVSKRLHIFKVSSLFVCLFFGFVLLCFVLLFLFLVFLMFNISRRTLIGVWISKRIKLLGVMGWMMLWGVFTLYSYSYSYSCSCSCSYSYSWIYSCSYSYSWVYSWWVIVIVEFIVGEL